MLERPKFLSFAQHGDDRGHLVVIEGGTDIPFQIKRTFYMYESSGDAVRGEHANRRSEFVLVNVAGASKVRCVEPNGTVTVYELDHPHTGVYIPKMVWKDMYDFTQDSVLLVLSSEHYDAKEYIRDYGEWCEEVGLSGASV